eukprot:5899552-Pyramimonas_sp.AAC.1
MAATSKASMTSRCLARKASPLLTMLLVLLVVELGAIVLAPVGHVGLVLLALEQHSVDLAIVVRGVAIICIVDSGPDARSPACRAPSAAGALA